MQFTQFTAARADTGAVLPYATATAYLAGTATKAALFDKVGASIGNPITSTSAGLIGFAAADALYDVQIVSADGAYSAPLIQSMQVVDLVGLRGTITLASSAALRAAPSAGLIDGSRTATNGYTTAGDGGNATYRWDAASTATDDGGSVINPTGNAGAGRWRVIAPEQVSVAAFGVNPGNSAAANKTALQAAITYAYGKRLVIPAFSSPIVYQSDTGTDLAVDVAALAAAGGMEIVGVAQNAQYGAALKNVGSGHGLKVNNATGGDYNGRFLLENFTIQGDATNTTGGSGIYLYRMNAGTMLRGMQAFDHRDHAVHADTCYSMQMDSGVYNNCRHSNIYFTNAPNNVILRGVKSFGAGRLYDAVSAGIEFDCLSSPGFGAVLIGCDTSYSGAGAFVSWARSNSSLVSIVVGGGGVVTVTTATAHGLTTGNYVAISGATVDPLLNSTDTLTIVVTGATTFTLPYSPAAAATYTESTLSVGPMSLGYWVKGMPGIKIDGFYCEVPSGPGLIITASTPFTITGGDSLNALFNVSSSPLGQISGVNLHGGRSRIVASSGSVPIKVGNSFNNGASGRNTAVCGSATYTPPSLATGAIGAATTVTVAGAAIGDAVACSFSLDSQGVEFVGRVTAANAVTVIPRNPTAGTVALGAGTLFATVTEAQR